MKEINDVANSLGIYDFAKCDHELDILNISLEDKIQLNKTNKKFSIFLFNYQFGLGKIVLPPCDLSTFQILIEKYIENKYKISQLYKLPNSYNNLSQNELDVMPVLTENKCSKYLEDIKTAFEKAYSCKIISSEHKLIRHAMSLTTRTDKISQCSCRHFCTATIQLFENKQITVGGYVDRISETYKKLVEESPEYSYYLKYGNTKPTDINLQEYVVLSAYILKTIIDILLVSITGYYINSNLSFNKQKKIGDEICNKLITINIDGFNKGHVIFDHEGQPIEEKCIIKNGILVGFINDTENAAILKQKNGDSFYNYLTGTLESHYLSMSANILECPLAIEPHITYEYIENQQVSFDIRTGKISFTVIGIDKALNKPCRSTISDDIINLLSKIVGAVGEPQIIENSILRNIILHFDSKD